MALSVTRQQPAQHDFVWPENSELTVTVTCTVTPTASVTSPTITLRRAVGGTAWTDVTPTISVNTNVITLAFTAADAAELRAAGGLLYEIGGTVGGDGPFPLVAGRVAPTAAGTAGGSSTTSATLAVTVGAAAVSLAIALGGSGGGGGGSTFRRIRCRKFQIGHHQAFAGPSFTVYDLAATNGVEVNEPAASRTPTQPIRFVSSALEFDLDPTDFTVVRQLSVIEVVNHTAPSFTLQPTA